MGPLKLEEIARLAARLDAGAALAAELPPTLAEHAWKELRAETEARLARAEAEGDLHEPIAWGATYEAERRLYLAERAAPRIAPPPERSLPKRPARKKRLARADGGPALAAPMGAAAQLSTDAARAAAPGPRPPSVSPPFEPRVPPPSPAPLPMPAPVEPPPVAPARVAQAPQPPPETVKDPPAPGLTSVGATLDFASLQGAIAAAEAAAAAKAALPFSGAAPRRSPQPAPSTGLPFARPAEAPRVDETQAGGGKAASALPFRPAPAEPGGGGDRFDDLGTVERYAELCAALQAPTPGPDVVFARFGLADPARRKRYDEIWKARLASNPVEYQAWQRAYWERLQRR